MYTDYRQNYVHTCNTNKLSKSHTKPTHTYVATYKLHIKLICILEMFNLYVALTHYLLSTIVICLQVNISSLIMNLSSKLST